MNKTTLFGIAVILIAISAQWGRVLDNDPLTQPDWGAAIAQVAAGLGLVVAADQAKDDKPKE